MSILTGRQHLDDWIDQESGIHYFLVRDPQKGIMVGTKDDAAPTTACGGRALGVGCG